MRNSVQNLMEEIKALRGEVVSVFGQPYQIPSTRNDLLVDVLDVLEGWRGHEADLTISRLDHEKIEELENEISELEQELACLEADEVERADRIEIVLDDLRSQLEEAEENYIETEADSISDFLDFLEECYGLEEKYSGNTTNQGGNITNDYYEHHYECGDGYHYVVLAVHRYGDIRANYTDEVLLRFDNEYSSYEAIAECGYRYETLEINGEEYTLDINARYEDIEVFLNGEYVCTIYDGNMSPDEARKEIARKLGVELVA